MSSGVAVATGGSSSLERARELILPVGVIACVLVILVPLPASLIDVLLVASITMSVIILLTTISVRTPLEFSIFSTLLLAATLGRLVLNVATTRLILTQADALGDGASGGVVQTFGDFVAHGNLVVGMVIFSIVVLIQFVVITKGATRISEVAARFALDGMPGRQMAIDADLNAGSIDEQTAKARRLEIQRQADFLGAMDGASKFVRGDAVAGVIITLVNIVGGLVIGIGQAGMSPVVAGNVFTKLTIGDGLASQIPALLISLAAGLLITRSSSSTHLPNEVLNQLFSRPQTLVVAAVFLGLLVFTSLPLVPLTLVAGSCIGLALLVTRSQKSASASSAETSAKAAQAHQPPVEDLLAIDPLEVEIGIGLIRLADRQHGGDLLQEIQQIRRDIAGRMGLLMPKVRVRDNVRLKPNQFRIKMSGAVIAESRANTSIMIAHELAVSVRRHADEFLTRDGTKYLIDQLRRSNPVVVDELVPDQMSLSEVQQVLKGLLCEQIPIRQLGLILEALGDNVTRAKNSTHLIESVRQRLARTISEQYRDKHGVLRVVTLDAQLDDYLQECIDPSDIDAPPSLAPQAVKQLCQQISDAVATLTVDRYPPVLLVNPQIRAAVRRFSLSRLPELIVLSYNEITQETDLEQVTTVTALQNPLVGTAV